MKARFIHYLSLTSALLSLPLAAQAALTVNTTPGNNTSPNGTVSTSTSSPAPGLTLVSANFSTRFAATLGGGGPLWRITDDPDVSSPIHASTVQFYVDNNGATQFQNGAETGTNNWIYMCSKQNDVLVYNGWVQVNIETDAITPILYVHDPAAPTTLIRLPAAVAAAFPPPNPFSARDIQIQSVNFATGVVELKNRGAGTGALDGWRFCSHDDNQSLVYSSSSGLNGVSIAAGASLFVHFNNDAPAGADHINRSTIGNFALPLNADAYGLGLYVNSGFGNGDNIADHVQWSLGGLDDGRADERSDEAESGGMWTDQSTWVPTSSTTTELVLTDPGNTTLHGPQDYLVLPDFGLVQASITALGELVLSWPAVNNLTVTVEERPDLLLGDWSTNSTTSSSGATFAAPFSQAGAFRLSTQVD